MKFSNKTQYGMRAVVYLAKNPDRFVSLKEISQNERAPLSFLEKILTQLEKAGVLESKKGISGGYRLKKSPLKTKASEVVEVLEDDIGIANCLCRDGFPCSLSKSCLTKSFWVKIQKVIYSSLKSVSLADLINKKV